MDRFQHFPLICVLHMWNAARFGMPLGFLEHLRRSNLPTIISTFHVGLSELWLLILFPLALLFHLMCCHRWAKFTKWILASCFWTRYLICCYCLYFSVMHWPQFVVQFIVAFLPNFRCSKTVMKAIERGSSRKIANLIQSKPKTQPKNQSVVQSRVQSRVQVLHRP